MKEEGKLKKKGRKEKEDTKIREKGKKEGETKEKEDKIEGKECERHTYILLWLDPIYYQLLLYSALGNSCSTEAKKNNHKNISLFIYNLPYKKNISTLFYK